MKHYMSIEEFIKNNYKFTNESNNPPTNSMQSNNEKYMESLSQLESLATQLEVLNKNIKTCEEKLEGIKKEMRNISRERYIIKLMHKLNISSFELDNYIIEIKKQKEVREMYSSTVKNFLKLLKDKDMKELIDFSEKVIEMNTKIKNETKIEINKKVTNESTETTIINEEYADLLNILSEKIISFSYSVKILKCLVNVNFNFPVAKELVTIKDLTN